MRKFTFFFTLTVPTTTTEAPTTLRTTSEGEIVTTGQPSTTTPGEMCERVLGMDDPQLVPDRFIEVGIIAPHVLGFYHNHYQYTFQYTT